MSGQWLEASRPLEERVGAFVDDLGAEELVAIALGDFTPLADRGLPAPDYVDSGTGLRGVEGATAFPAGIALAATFDAALAEAYGAAVGAEARASGFPVVLGPTLDLARDPRAGRIPEAFGEDPFLSGLLGAAHVRGLQANHVIAQLKHFVAYNGESRRTGYGLGAERGDAVNVKVSQAVLQDAYLRPFRAAIEAGAWSMMGSYNRINGEYACESVEILSIPRTQWNWQGFYCPDFLFAVRDDAKALAAGLDLGALGGPGRRTPEMVATAEPRLVTALVTNLVRALIGSGLADHPLPAPSMPSTEAHLRLAEECAAAAMVLLRNEDAALPFGDDVRSLAVIGPSGTDALFVTGGSAAVTLVPERLVSPVDGLRARAGDRRIEVSQGSLGDISLTRVPAAAFRLPDGSGSGVEVLFTEPDGNTRREILPVIDHEVDLATGWPGRWRARLTSTVTGPHRLSLTFGGRARVHLDGEEVMSGSRELERFLHGPEVPMHVVVDLVAGEPALLQIDLEPGPAILIPPMGLGPSLRLGWQQPDDLIDRATEVAGGCDAAIILVNMASSEGMDRDGITLPGDQYTLVRRVAAANPRTVVVLNTPGAVLLPWLDDVAAVLQVWYPGERFGAALASVVFGDVEPSGRLPLTFPMSRSDLPGGDHGPDTDPTDLDYDGDAGLGYRSSLVRAHGALFAFGHGLGYAATSVEVEGATVAGGEVRVRLAVTNPGVRDTTSVVQLYAVIGSDAPELVGVVRVPVPAGATAGAEAGVGSAGFARWDGVAGDRVPVDGTHELWVGVSSADLGRLIRVRVEGGEVVGVEQS